MSKQDIIEIVSNAIDLASNYDDEYEILNFITDNVPGLKIGFTFRKCISDYLLKNKLEKFKIYANEFTQSSDFKNFKNKINADLNYRKRISEYMLLKINKFDTDSKLNIFSKACVDFFEGNISEEILEELSEILDLITFTDIKIIKTIYSEFGKTTCCEYLVCGVTDEACSKITSSLVKMDTLGLLVNRGQKVNDIPTYDRGISYFKQDIPTWIEECFSQPIITHYCISDLGELLLKYI